jgi:hypothetical protein
VSSGGSFLGGGDWYDFRDGRRDIPAIEVFMELDSVTQWRKQKALYSQSIV